MAVDPFVQPDVVAQIVEGLQGATDPLEQVALVKRLRNSIIGNKHRKIRLCASSEYLTMCARGLSLAKRLGH